MMNRIFGTRDLKPAKEEVTQFRRTVLHEDQSVRALNVGEIKDLGDFAWTYVRLLFVSDRAQQAVKQEHERKGTPLTDDEKAKIFKKAGVTAVQTFFGELKNTAWLTKDKMTPQEIAWVDEAFEKHRKTSVVAVPDEKKAPVKEGEEEKRDEPEAFFTAEATVNPATLRSDPVVPRSASGMLLLDPHDLILYLADGLQYDKFSSADVRKILFTKREPPTIQEMITMCAAYIYVGNNAAKLTTKVSSIPIGQQTLSVLNTFGVVARKAGHDSVTLSRIGIAFAPVVWALRNIYFNSGKLQTAGVGTTTPKVLQDVALSGVSQFINDGNQIQDFLEKFNVVLTKAREKTEKSKSSPDDMKDQAIKFFELAKSGVQEDQLIANWPYNDPNSKQEPGIQAFYEAALVEARGVETI